MTIQRVMVRTSERSTFKECRQRWWWGYNLRLAKAGPPSAALRFGTLVHQALAAYYKPGIRRGPHPATTFSKLYEAELLQGWPQLYLHGDEFDDKAVDGGILGPEMLTNYIDLYGKDERYEIIQPEQDFQLDILNPKTGKYLFTYVSEMDAVVKDRMTGKLGLFEHKTSSSTRMDPFGAPLALDEQGSAYWTFGTMWLHETGQLKPDEDLDFMLYNFLRKASKDLRKTDTEGHALNKDGSISKRQPLPLFRRENVMRGKEEREVVFRRALNEFREMEMVRQGKLAIYKAPGRHCNFCQFRDMCEVHETGSDWEPMLDMYGEWDPYEIHHKREKS